MPTRLLPCLAFLGVVALSAFASGFDDLGVPVTVGMNMGWLIGANAIAPATYSITELAQSPVPITCGFALAPDAVYFGSGVHLYRYRF
jgi:hypothetical protein